tara:strand:+ start:35 stop:358 length:324 start_codon:yes stop_codon:yes gene_type:complete
MPGNEFVYWYLTQAYHAINETDKAQSLHNKAKGLIDQLATLISNEADRTFYHNIYFHKRIQEDLITEKVLEAEKTDSPAVFAFCPSCGFKNENNFAFCPGCGNDLKQ